MRTCKWRINADVSDRQEELPGFIDIFQTSEVVDWLLLNFFDFELLLGILVHRFGLDMLK